MTGSSFQRFILFDQVSSEQSIESAFNLLHQKLSDRYTNWKMTSSKKSMMAAYWYSYVLPHYIVIIIVPLISMCLGTYLFTNATAIFFAAIFVAPLLYLALFIFLYNPTFKQLFLPVLDNIVEMQIQSEKEGIQKSKQQQMKGLSLVLIQLVLNKLAGLPSLTLSESCKQLLARQYGISGNTIDNCLRLILNSQPEISKRQQTEIADAFAEARGWFTTFYDIRAQDILTEIFLKLSQGKRLAD